MCGQRRLPGPASIRAPRRHHHARLGSFRAPASIRAPRRPHYARLGSFGRRASGDRSAPIAYAAAHHIKSLVGITVDVQVKAPGAVPRSQGKAVRVRDLRPKDPS